jgi:dTDP-L-rhamnose 4-epimerase
LPKKVLITGGAGFIGSHLADELLRVGHEVRVLDSLVAQVHGAERRRPAYLHKDVQLIVGDVRDRAAVGLALDGVDAVYHFAALVGVGQSMYQVEDYTSVNNLGTAVLMEALAKKPVSKLVVASSMSVYGEGLYRDRAGTLHDGRPRNLDQLRRGAWEVCDADGEALVPVPTPEGKTLTLESVYALSKYDQERMGLILGRAYKIPTVALRFFNVYGPRQALSNPYTGVLAIFASRLINDSRPLVFEDGHQQRDFVSVYDVARACRLALEKSAADGSVMNIGSGQVKSVRQVAEQVAHAVGKDITPEITGKYRMGDVRHCFADISRAGRVLGYAPAVTFGDGIEELASWLRGRVSRDRVVEARAELEARGLTL